MVGRWHGGASRSLVMHADPLAAYAYRWLGGVVPTQRIDRMFGWFWRHLRGLGRMFDSVICANEQLAARLRDGGLGNAQTVPMGVEGRLFSPSLRSAAVREEALGALGLDARGTLLLGVGRFSAEKRWNMVLRAVGEAARRRPVGMLLVGDGSKKFGLELVANRTRHVALLPPIRDREELARLIASADALVHGCEAETFCMVAAEARASGIPLIVPDRGAAVGQLVSGAGTVFRSGSQISLERAIGRFLDRGPELQRAAAVRASRVRTMDEHFADLFAHYEALAPQHAAHAAPQATAELALNAI
jgi:alpha-1,6-mannosyltransferase